MAAVDDYGVIIATAYHVFAIGREVYTVYAIGILPKDFRYSKRAKHLVCQLHNSAGGGSGHVCVGSFKNFNGRGQVALRNIYGIWAGGGIFSFEIFKMAEGEEAISKVC